MQGCKEAGMQCNDKGIKLPLSVIQSVFIVFVVAQPLRISASLHPSLLFTSSDFNIIITISNET
jgi:hypothetical protein